LSFKVEEIKKDGFEATVGTLICDNTNLKMSEIIIRPSDRDNYIEARWENEKLPTSGTHFVKGNLSCSPIETPTQKTAIIKSVVINKDDKQINRLVVKKI